MSDDGLQALSSHIASVLGADVLSADVRLGELVISARSAAIARVLQYLRDDVRCEFGVLVDICGVDYPEREARFEIVYNLLSLTLNQRARVKVAAREDEMVRMASERGRSKNTLAAYRRDLGMYSEWLDEQGSDLHSVDRELLDSYVNRQIGRAHV